MKPFSGLNQHSSSRRFLSVFLAALFMAGPGIALGQEPIVIYEQGVSDPLEAVAEAAALTGLQGDLPAGILEAGEERRLVFALPEDAHSVRVDLTGSAVAEMYTRIEEEPNLEEFDCFAQPEGPDRFCLYDQAQRLHVWLRGVGQQGSYRVHVTWLGGEASRWISFEGFPESEVMERIEREQIEVMEAHFQADQINLRVPAGLDLSFLKSLNDGYSQLSIDTQGTVYVAPADYDPNCQRRIDHCREGWSGLMANIPGPAFDMQINEWILPVFDAQLYPECFSESTLISFDPCDPVHGVVWPLIVIIIMLVTGVEKC